MKIIQKPLWLLSYWSLFHVVIETRGFRSTSNNCAIRYHRKKISNLWSTTERSSSVDPVNDATKKSEQIGSIVFLIPPDACKIQTKFGSSSPVGNPNLQEAVHHLCTKARYYADSLIDTRVVEINDNISALQEEKLESATIVLAMGVSGEHEMRILERLWEKRNATVSQDRFQMALQCGRDLPAVVGPLDTNKDSLKSRIPWTREATAKRLLEQMTDLFARWNSDDFCLALMLFLNQFSGHEIDWVKHSIDATWEKGPIRNAQELQAMITSCGDCIADCVKDDNCRECLDRLTAIDTRDQVASYRTIVSYESTLLRDFSYCILQKNNIFQCDAEIPSLPKVEPLSFFRGQPVTADLAKALLVGHLSGEATALEGAGALDVSWKVACGANEAYDKFPSQNQLFYPAKSGKNMWYDPVFRVETLDGRHVWCKRHYRVAPGAVPGTFYFSVLDNGITSNEFWTIVAAADDLSWIVFHYAGAAPAVGQRYLGGLLCTADGQLPSTNEQAIINEALRSAGIQPWELYVVDNDEDSPVARSAGPPPLNYFRDLVQGNNSIK